MSLHRKNRSFSKLTVYICNKITSKWLGINGICKKGENGRKLSPTLFQKIYAFVGKIKLIPQGIEFFIINIFLEKIMFGYFDVIAWVVQKIQNFGELVKVLYLDFAEKTSVRKKAQENKKHHNLSV